MPRATKELSPRGCASLDNHPAKTGHSGFPHKVLPVSPLLPISLPASGSKFSKVGIILSKPGCGSHCPHHSFIPQSCGSSCFARSRPLVHTASPCRQVIPQNRVTLRDSFQSPVSPRILNSPLL